MSDKTIEFLVKKNDELERLDLFLKSKMNPISRSSIQKFIDQGVGEFKWTSRIFFFKKIKK